MAPYEALYGRKCRCPVYWDEEGTRILEGVDPKKQCFFFFIYLLFFYLEMIKKIKKK